MFRARTRRALSPVQFQAACGLAGLAIGFLGSELHALLTGGPHVLIIFGVGLGA